MIIRNCLCSFFDDSSCTTESSNTHYTYQPLSQCTYNSTSDTSDKYTCSASFAYLNSYGSSTSCSGTPITTSQACVASVTSDDKHFGNYYSITCNPAASSGLPTTPTNYLTLQSCSSTLQGSYPLGTCHKDADSAASYVMTASTSGSVTTVTMNAYITTDCSLGSYGTFSFPLNATCANGSPYFASVTTAVTTLASLQTTSVSCSTGKNCPGTTLTSSSVQSSLISGALGSTSPPTSSDSSGLSTQSIILIAVLCPVGVAMIGAAVYFAFFKAAAEASHAAVLLSDKA